MLFARCSASTLVHVFVEALTLTEYPVAGSHRPVAATSKGADFGESALSVTNTLPTRFHLKKGSVGEEGTSFWMGAYTWTKPSSFLSLRKTYLQVSAEASSPRNVVSDSPQALYTASFGRCAVIVG